MNTKWWISEKIYDIGDLHIYDGKYDYVFSKDEKNIYFTVHDGLSRGDNNLIEEGEINGNEICSYYKASVLKKNSFIMEQLNNLRNIKEWVL